MAKPKRLKNLDRLVAVAVADPGFTAREAGGDSALVGRLVSHPEMKRVWDELGQLAEKGNDEHLPLDVMTLLVALPGQWARMSKVSTANARKDVREIAATARKLAHMLEAHRAELSLLAGYKVNFPSILEADLIAAGRKEQADQLKKWNWAAGAGGEPPVIPDHPELLKSLADKLDKATKAAPIGIRPTKPNDPNAARTHYVQQLAAYLDERTGGKIPKSALNSLVASAVNVMVDDPNSFLTPSHVALLLKT